MVAIRITMLTVLIRITMLTVQLETQQLLNKLWAGFDVIFRIALQWHKEQFIKFLGVIWITMLTLQIGIKGNMGVMGCCGQGNLRSLNALVNQRDYSDSVLYIYIGMSDNHSFHTEKSCCMTGRVRLCHVELWNRRRAGSSRQPLTQPTMQRFQLLSDTLSILWGILCWITEWERI